jgi:hypothetical protein
MGATTSFVSRQSVPVAAENTTGAGGLIRPGQILASDHYGLIVGAGASTRLGEETLKVWGAQAIALKENEDLAVTGLAAHPEGMQGDADPAHRAPATAAMGATTSFVSRQSVPVTAENTTGAGGLIRPGQVLVSDQYGLIVAAGAGSFLSITHLQRPGGKRLTVADYLQGHPLAPGLCFDGPAA